MSQPFYYSLPINAPLNVALIGIQSSKKPDELSSTEYKLFPQQFSIFFCLQGNPAQQANFVLFVQVTQPSDINSNLWVEGIQ